jgi:hypothetical protein
MGWWVAGDLEASLAWALLTAPLGVLAYRSGGARRLWSLWAPVCTIVLFADAVYDHFLPCDLRWPHLDAAWAPLTVFLCGLTIHALGEKRLPWGFQTLVAVLLAFGVLGTGMHTSIKDSMHPERLRDYLGGRIACDWEAWGPSNGG